MSKMLFKHFRQGYCSACKFTVSIISADTGKWLGEFTADYTDPTDNVNIGLVIDLYNLEARLVDVNVNSATNLLIITVSVDTKQPLFKYSIWGGEPWTV